MQQDIITSVFVLVSTLAVTPALAEPFTYQGQFQDAGAPAEGMYDFRFQLFDAPVSGSQIGPTLTFDDVEVLNGLFQVDPDFGDVFNQDDAYIFIEVREGSSSGAYTRLLPRIPVTATPKAQHASTADTVLNQQWSEAPGILTYGDGNDRVLINRSNAITSAEYFGIYGNNLGFVGMYVAGPAGSFPFYGYSIDSNVSAYTVVDDSDNWKVVFDNGNVALSMSPQGDAVIARDAFADSFKFPSPKTNYASVMGDSFHAASEDPFTASSGGPGAFITSTGQGYLVAPVQLPHGATVSSVRFYYRDAAPNGDLSMSLIRKDHGFSGFETIATASSSGVNNFNILTLEDTAIRSAIINNNFASYQLRVFSANWPGDSSLTIESVVIEYTTTEAD